jgi:hypothetical protein
MVLPGCGDDNDRGFNPDVCNDFNCPNGVCIDDDCVIGNP